MTKLYNKKAYLGTEIRDCNNYERDTRFSDFYFTMSYSGHVVVKSRYPYSSKVEIFHFDLKTSFLESVHSLTIPLLYPILFIWFSADEGIWNRLKRMFGIGISR